LELPNRRELESRFNKRVLRLSKRHRRELRELLGYPPDPSNVPQSFWDRVENETREETAVLLLMLFVVSARSHIRQVGGSFESVRSRIIQQGEAYSQEQSSQIANRYAEGARLGLQSKRIKWNQDEEGGILTKSRVEEDLEKILGRGRAERISVNGTTEAITAGGDTGVGMTVGISQDDLWINRPWMSRTGPCPICKPLHRTKRSEWGQKYPNGPGESVHSHCVCVIQYAAERV